MMRKFSTCVLLTFGLAISPGILRAAETSFDFKDPKGVNTISFLLDSTLEPILGVGGGISGSLTFDSAKPEATKGKIELEASSLYTPNDGMKKAMHSSDWLDIAKFPKITFEIKQVKEAKAAGKDKFDLTVVADLTIKGTKKEVTVPVSATYLPDALGKRQGDAKGDLLVLRSSFSINRKDYGIKSEMGGDVVAEEAKITVSIAGGAKK